jgi:hypothetical protein
MPDAAVLFADCAAATIAGHAIDTPPLADVRRFSSPDALLFYLRHFRFRFAIFAALADAMRPLPLLISLLPGLIRPYAAFVYADWSLRQMLRRQAQPIRFRQPMPAPHLLPLCAPADGIISSSAGTPQRLSPGDSRRHFHIAASSHALRLRQVFLRFQLADARLVAAAPMPSSSPPGTLVSAPSFRRFEILFSAFELRLSPPPLSLLRHTPFSLRFHYLIRDTIDADYFRRFLLRASHFARAS